MDFFLFWFFIKRKAVSFHGMKRHHAKLCSVFADVKRQQKNECFLKTHPTAKNMSMDHGAMCCREGERRPLNCRSQLQEHDEALQKSCYVPYTCAFPTFVASLQRCISDGNRILVSI